jgi:isopentenyl-diphosphate delta-isomerase
MKDEVVNQVTNKKDNQKKQSRIIGIFIVNNNKEMLLQKKLTSHQQAQQLWQTPYLIHHESPIAPITTAQIYVEKLGINCELQEAFTINQTINQSSKHRTNHGEHVIIAVVKETQNQRHTASDAYTWVPINHVLHDAHENPSKYAQWFRKTLEGVNLYLKNQNKKVNTIATHTLSEI